MTTPEAQPEVRLADETMEYLHRQMRKAVREGIADALHQAITPERAREFFVGASRCCAKRHRSTPGGSSWTA